MSVQVAQRIRFQICRFIYTFFLFILLPILLLLLNKKLKNTDAEDNLSNRKFRERFGLLPPSIQTSDIVFHCVSIGEINAAASLIRQIQSQLPDRKITLTTSSLTGAVHAKNLFKDTVQHCFLPIDLPFSVSAFLNRIKPTLVIITEVEIWPNLMTACEKRNIKTCLLNGRLSDNSLSTYKRLNWLLRPVFKSFDLILAQSQSSYDNFIRLGLPKSLVKLSQNTKFDVVADPNDRVNGSNLLKDYQLTNKTILLGASTHTPEESIIIEAFRKHKSTFPDLSLLLVPRHPHRFDEVYEICKATGFSVIRFSDEQAVEKSPDILLMDTMGWLKACYSICSAAFIGGSFAEKGGHNALECAAFAKPMVMGPSIYNNPVICQQLEEVGALSILGEPSDLERTIEQLLKDPVKAERAGESGLTVLQKNSGAVAFSLEKVVQLLLEK